MIRLQEFDTDKAKTQFFHDNALNWHIRQLTTAKLTKDLNEKTGNSFNTNNVINFFAEYLIEFIYIGAKGRF